jgi:hypothetical protein
MFRKQHHPPAWNPGSTCCLFVDGSLFGLFNPEHGGATFLLNVDGILPNYTQLQSSFCLPTAYFWFLLRVIQSC